MSDSLHEELRREVRRHLYDLEDMTETDAFRELKITPRADIWEALRALHRALDSSYLVPSDGKDKHDQAQKRNFRHVVRRSRRQETT